MPLPLPFVIADANDIQSNFEALSQQFPLSRRHMTVETPHNVGDAGEPAFQNGWVNYSPPDYQVARFWRDPVGIVHVEGLVKSGTTALPIFTLPAGYRPSKRLVFPTFTNTGVGRVDVFGNGEVVIINGTNGYAAINVSFRQEQ